MDEEEETPFPYRRIPINKSRENEEIEKSPLEQACNCCRQGARVNETLVGKKDEEK